MKRREFLTLVGGALLARGCGRPSVFDDRSRSSEVVQAVRLTPFINEGTWSSMNSDWSLLCDPHGGGCVWRNLSGGNVGHTFVFGRRGCPDLPPCEWNVMPVDEGVGAGFLPVHWTEPEWARIAGGTWVGVDDNKIQKSGKYYRIDVVWQQGGCANVHLVCRAVVREVV